MRKEFELPQSIQEAVALRGGEKPQTVVFDRNSKRQQKRVIDYVVFRAASRVINQEGSPIYLWPNPERPTQGWSSPAFIGGHETVTRISQYLDPSYVSHAVLFDDFNGRPQGSGEVDLQQQVHSLYDSSPSIAASPIFDFVAHPATRRYLEHSFVTEAGANVCSTLDSAFQREKLLLFAGGQEGMTLTDEQIIRLHESQIVMVHPSSFKQQQSLMLTALLSDMKKPPFSSLTKIQRRDLLSDIYRHVWLNDTTGQLEAVTEPVWDGNKFIFKEVVDL